MSKMPSFAGRFVKGTRVLVHATVHCGYQHSPDAEVVYEPKQKCRPGWKRSLTRLTVTVPYEGIVVGHSWRETGVKTYDQYEGSANYLMYTKRHQVVMVQPTHTSRWLKPYVCLVKDLEFADETE